MVIAGVTLGIALLANVLRPKDIKWFRRLQRPRWLTFERWIPVIWAIVFVCGAISAHQVWQQAPGQPETWQLMLGYVVLELLVVAFSPVLLWTHQLQLATAIGLAGFAWGLLLTFWVSSQSWLSAMLLIPYLLWAPVGSYTTWSMAQLNETE